MPAALPIVGGVIAGAGAIGAAAISSHATKEASQTAASAQAAATDEQLKIAQMQEQLARDIYAANTANETPYLNSGYGALSVENQLLGLKPMSAADFNSGNWYAPGTIDYSKPSQVAAAPPPPIGGTNGSGSSTSTPPTSAQTIKTLAQIMAEQNDGIPGNYAADLSAYYAANPVSASQLAAMKNDGIPGNYAAASGHVAQPQASSAAYPQSYQPYPQSYSAQPTNAFADLIPQQSAPATGSRTPTERNAAIGGQRY